MDKLICYCYEICKLETHRHTLTHTYRHVHKESYIRLDATRNPIATQKDQSSSNKVKAKSHAPLPPTPYIQTYRTHRTEQIPTESTATSYLINPLPRG